MEAFWSPDSGGCSASLYSAVQKAKAEGGSGKVATGKMELLKQSREKAEGQGSFEEGFQVLVCAFQTASLLMLPPWTRLGKLSPGASQLGSEKQTRSIHPCFIPACSVWRATRKLAVPWSQSVFLFSYSLNQTP